MCARTTPRCGGYTMLQQITKRKYPRFNKDCEVRYKVLELDEMAHEGITVNISGGGICFKSEEELPLETVVAVEITLPGAKSPVVAMGKVVWRKTESDGSWLNGVEFWWLGYRGEEGEGPTEPMGGTQTE